MLDHVAQLRALVPRVERHDHGARERDAEEGLDELDAVVHQDADMLARLDAERVKATRDVASTGEDLRVRRAPIRHHEREPIGVRLGGAQQEVGQRHGPHARIIASRGTLVNSAVDQRFLAGGATGGLAAASRPAL